MQSQQVRDDKTLTIVTSLGRGLLVLVVGALALWCLDVLAGLPDSTLGVLTWLIILSAVAVVVARLVRVGQSGSTR